VIYDASSYGAILNNEFDDVFSSSNSCAVVDHLGGFNINTENEMLDAILSVNNDIIIHVEYILHETVYGNNTRFYNETPLYRHFHGYNVHPRIEFDNFLCSFNGSAHVSRQLLSSIINKFGYFNPVYCSKNFAYSNGFISEQLRHLDLTTNEIQLYSKFFIDNSEFNDTIYSFGHVRYDHARNIYNLEDKLTKSFVHIVSETMATSYCPSVSEKFLYSIVTRGLFVAYAQPNWHAHIEQYYGFKLYDTIFDYRFDKIKNPVKRLVALMEMISKFSHLSIDDWNDLYLMEQDNIEYNYDHYFSKRYLDVLKQHE